MFQKKNLLILLTIFTVISNSALAEDAVFLEQGQKSPYPGILVPQDTLQELRRSVIELDNEKAINLSLTKSVQLYKDNESLLQTKVNTLTDQNNKLSESLYSAKNTSDLERFAYFAAGAILTGLTSYGIYKAGIAR